MSFIKERASTTRGAGVDRLKVLVYGPAGCGKTYLASTTPDQERTVVISAEAGLLTLSGFDLTAVEISSLPDLAAVLVDLQSGTYPFTWVILDSLSEICEVCLSYELSKNRDPRKAYGEMQNRMLDLVRQFRDLPLNVVMTAKMERDTSGTDVFMGPSCPGQKLSHKVGHYFDFLFPLRTFTDEEGTVRRSLQTQPSEGYVAKSRVSTLDTYIEPSLAYLQSTVKETT
jgi:hypothetical protein